jgi:hypothetical protein
MTSSKDEMRRQLNNAYIETKLNNIIEPMVKDMLHEQPSDHVSLTSRYADYNFYSTMINHNFVRLTS